MSSNKNDVTTFLDRINKMWDEAVGYESYGDATEFYDEDGIVLMVARSVGQNEILFNFGNDECFRYGMIAS